MIQGTFHTGFGKVVPTARDEAASSQSTAHCPSPDMSVLSEAMSALLDRIAQSSAPANDVWVQLERSP